MGGMRQGGEWVFSWGPLVDAAPFLETLTSSFLHVGAADVLRRVFPGKSVSVNLCATLPL